MVSFIAESVVNSSEIVTIAVLTIYQFSECSIFVLELYLVKHIGRFFRLHFYVLERGILWEN